MYVIKPIWTYYGIQLWGNAANSNLEILQRFQPKVLRQITGAPWFVTNEILHCDLNIATVKEETKKTADKYRSKLDNHPNPLVIKLMTTKPGTRRLKRRMPSDL